MSMDSVAGWAFGPAVARRLTFLKNIRLARRALLSSRLILVCLTFVTCLSVGRGAWAAELGHCMAVSPAGGCEEQVVKDNNGILLPGLHIFFTEPTNRYGHDVLGGTPEWGGLAYLQQGSASHGPYEGDEIILPKDHVFEDLTPRLADLDDDGSAEIIVIESDVRRGAALAVYDIQNGRLVKAAETPHIGTSNRWLAPLGAADLDGDGAVELAYVDRPHLAKTLRVWRYLDGQLIEIAAMSGVTNHRIGEAFISGGIRNCNGVPDIITADARWRRVIATRLVDGKLVARDIGSFAGRGSLDDALACN